MRTKLILCVNQKNYNDKWFTSMNGFQADRQTYLQMLTFHTQLLLKHTPVQFAQSLRENIVQHFHGFCL